MANNIYLKKSGLIWPISHSDIQSFRSNKVTITLQVCSGFQVALKQVRKKLFPDPTPGFGRNSRLSLKCVYAWHQDDIYSFLLI